MGHIVNNLRNPLKSKFDNVNKGKSNFQPLNQYNYFIITLELIKLLDKSKTIYSSSKRIKDDHELLVTVILRRNTDSNKLSQDIVFGITIDKDFPESEPYVKCHTNVIILLLIHITHIIIYSVLLSDCI